MDLMSRSSLVLPFFHPRFYTVLIQMILAKPDVHHEGDKKNQVLGDSVLVSPL